MAEEERSPQEAERDERPHDVLAADEFAMPTRVPHPADPHSDEREPHDVLAADEFAMPAGGAQAAPVPDAGPRPPLRLVLAFAALAYLVMRRRRG